MWRFGFSGSIIANWRWHKGEGAHIIHRQLVVEHYGWGSGRSDHRRIVGDVYPVERLHFGFEGPAPIPDEPDDAAFPIFRKPVTI